MAFPPPPLRSNGAEVTRPNRRLAFPPPPLRKQRGGGYATQPRLRCTPSNWLGGHETKSRTVFPPPPMQRTRGEVTQPIRQTVHPQ